MEPLLRFRLAIVGVSTFLAALLDVGHPTADWRFFILAADRLLSPAWATTFSDPALQAGPILLAFVGTVERALSSAPVHPYVVFALATYLAASFGGIAAYRTLCRALGGTPRAAVELTATVAVLVFGLPSDAFLAGHSSHIWMPVLWMGAAAAAVRGRMIVGALLVALGVGLETWGILGAPVLLLAPTLRQAVLSAGTAAAAVATMFAPFFLLGDVHTGSYVWAAVPDAPVHLLFGVDRVTWLFRILQGGLATTAAGIAALARRRQATLPTVLSVPLLGLVLRLFLDPLTYADYYYVSARFIGVWLTAVLIADRRVAAVPALVATYLMLVAGPGAAPHLIVLGVAVPVAVYVLIDGRADRAVRPPVGDDGAVLSRSMV